MTHTEIIASYLPKGISTLQFGNMFMAEVNKDNLLEIADALFNTHALPVKTVFATDDRVNNLGFNIYYVFAVPKEHIFITLHLPLGDSVEFPSLVGRVHAAALYEGRICEMFGLVATGLASAPQPTLLHENWPSGVFPLRKDFAISDIAKPATAHMEYIFSRVEGEGIYEVPVGPVHAGIIEPGHFRFSMAGEQILNLEAKLGWVHKGSEKVFESLSLEDKVKLSERIAGDTSFTHSTAFCQAVEELSGLNVPPRAGYLRVIFSELERLANHFNDIGFIMLDTGFNFGGAQMTRMRERIQQKNEELTGSRFLRGVNAVGGVTKNISSVDAEKLLKEIDLLETDVRETLNIAEESSVLENRIAGTGRVTLKVARDHSAVGVPGRASGISVDARADFPYAGYAHIAVTPMVETEGDVKSRYRVRIREVAQSFEILREALQKLPEGEIRTKNTPQLRKNSFAIGIAEGWRGDMVYVLATDSTGLITRVSVRDPSFINWHLPPFAAPGNLILDFPLINKSFNLSYTGSDT